MQETRSPHYTHPTHPSQERIFGKFCANALAGPPLRREEGGRQTAATVCLLASPRPLGILRHISGSFRHLEHFTIALISARLLPHPHLHPTSSPSTHTHTHTHTHTPHTRTHTPRPSFRLASNTTEIVVLEGGSAKVLKTNGKDDFQVGWGVRCPCTTRLQHLHTLTR